MNPWIVQDLARERGRDLLRLGRPVHSTASLHLRFRLAGARRRSQPAGSTTAAAPAAIAVAGPACSAGNG